ncbi:uncharacterized protein LOC113463924, partial [Ceratina calcarata]|uniref:Uncharacterized protein LOC113463924 n=1 Tax=Ceratina calcarata TaxID=156304 RepID=A0AAJ7RXI0_9HYME
MLYSLLAVYSILKPPRYGNCTVDETSLPNRLITISDLKEIYNEKKQSKLISLKIKLDDLIENDEWEFSDVAEHDYSQAGVIDCVIYYVTGYLVKQILKRTKCNKCRESLLIHQNEYWIAEQELVSLKSKFNLIHCNIHFFKMIQYLENIQGVNLQVGNILRT